MSNLIVQGDLLECTEKYLCHQCNCVTTYAAGIAKSIFEKFSYADIYRERNHGEKPAAEQLPGNIIVCGNGLDRRFVINMMGQYFPGKPRYPNSTKDGYATRQEAFRRCLAKIEELSDLESVAFPFKIGCNLAGGDWNVYQRMIENFAHRVQVPVRIYQLT